MLEEPAIIFEDNRVIVVIKPQNIPCVADDSGDESLQEQLKNYIRRRDNKEGDVFVGVVHRLDRVTGGVMMYARTGKAAERLSEQITAGTMEKTYLAVVSGEPKQRTATLVNYLAKDEVHNMVAVVPQTTTGAKRAELSYEVISTVRGGEVTGVKGGSVSGGSANRGESVRLSLLKVKLSTGRSHQIRVQMRHIGHPLVGDRRYGGAAADNIALWAHQLEFVHPSTGDQMKFIVNPPETGVWANFDFDRRGHKLRGKDE